MANSVCTAGLQKMKEKNNFMPATTVLRGLLVGISSIEIIPKTWVRLVNVNSFFFDLTSV